MLSSAFLLLVAVTQPAAPAPRADTGPAPTEARARVSAKILSATRVTAEEWRRLPAARRKEYVSNNPDGTATLLRITEFE